MKQNIAVSWLTTQLTDCHQKKKRWEDEEKYYSFDNLINLINLNGFNDINYTS